MRRFALVVMLVVVGCAKGGGRGEPGKERGDCRMDEHMPCDKGLLCLSNLCVKPPPADCAAIGETLASMDLGNYAEPEERAPVVAKYKAACTKAYVSKEEGKCIDEAKDKWSAGQCAPRMFPELASTNTGNCKPVIAKIEAAMKGTVQGLDQPNMQQWMATMLRVMTQSCEQDAWPDALKKCILMQTSQSADAMQACNQQFPPALQTKLQERLTTAMREQMQ